MMVFMISSVVLVSVALHTIPYHEHPLYSNGLTIVSYIYVVRFFFLDIWGPCSDY